MCVTYAYTCKKSTDGGAPLLFLFCSTLCCEAQTRNEGRGGIHGSSLPLRTL